jgi:hypothetical protein
MAQPMGKSNKGAHRRQLEKHKGIDLLPDKECPYALAHVWAWFLDISGSRTSAGFGMNPIAYSEIDAWARLTGQRPTAIEVGILKRLDRLYILVTAKNND